jgi:cytochrome P450
MVQTQVSPTLLPPGPRRGWLPGRLAMSFTHDPLAFLTGMASQYGDLSQVQFGSRRLILLNHPDFIHAVLVKDQSKFVKSEVLRRTRFLLGDGLLTSEGELHAHQRRLIQPIFHTQRIESYAGQMVRAASRLSTHWQDGQAVDIHEEMMRLTLMIVGRTLFNADLEGEAQAVGRAVDDVLANFNRLFNPISPWLLRIPTPGMQRFNQAVAYLDQTIDLMIAARQVNGGGNDLLSLLLQAQQADANHPDPQAAARQARDEAMTLLLAGHETTANALAFTWYLLANNPQVEARLQAELDEVLGGRPPDVSDLDRLVYTRQVLSEALRLFPPAWLIGRQALADYPLGGYVIPKGATVIMSQWVMQHDSRYYPDPQVFDPDRWTPLAQAARPRFAYFPFGGGPRVCIGEGFAWMEATLVLATLAQAWTVRTLSPRPPELQAVITLRPRHGIPATLRRRQIDDPNR